MTEVGIHHLGGVHAAYELEDDAFVDLIAHILTRNSSDGWQNSLAAASAADLVYMENARNAPKEASASSDPALAAFSDWAAR